MLAGKKNSKRTQKSCIGLFKSAGKCCVLRTQHHKQFFVIERSPNCINGNKIYDESVCFAKRSIFFANTNSFPQKTAKSNLTSAGKHSTYEAREIVGIFCQKFQAIKNCLQK
jgi:hypothetical protein